MKIISNIFKLINPNQKGKKSKAVAKQGSAKYQWQIMKSLGFKDDEISKFADYDQELSFSKLFQFPARILMEHIRMKNSLESMLQIDSISSIRIRPRRRVQKSRDLLF